jgi:hypothetical protein
LKASNAAISSAALALVAPPVGISKTGLCIPSPRGRLVAFIGLPTGSTTNIAPKFLL